MTRDEAKEIMSKVTFYWELGEQTFTQNQINEALDMAIKALETPPNDNWEGYSSRLWKSAYERGKAEAEQRWIPVKTRPITHDEIEEFGWKDKDESWRWMYDCELPDDGQEVLIQSEYGIDFTTFYNEGSEGCYFEDYEDSGDVIAWMPLPEPYKAESEE